MISIYSGPQAEGHDSFLKFVATALKFTDAKVKKLGAQYDAEVGAIPLGDLLSAPIARVHGVDHDEIGLSRGDLRKARQRQSKP